MARCQVHPHGRPERHPHHVRALDADRGQEAGDLLRVPLGRVRPVRLVALARPWKVKRNAPEMLGVGRQLEGVARVVGGGVGDQQERLTARPGRRN